MTGGGPNTEPSRSHSKRSGVIVGFSLAFTILGASMGLADHFLGIFGFAVVRQELKDEMAHTSKKLEQSQAELAELKQRYAIVEQEKRNLETRIASADALARNAAQGSPVAQATPQPAPRPAPAPDARYREQIDGLYDLLRAESYDSSRSQLLREHLGDLRPELEFDDMLRFLLLFESDYRFNMFESMQRKLRVPLDRDQIAQLEKIDWGSHNNRFRSEALRLKIRLNE